MSPKEQYNLIIAEKVIVNLKKRNMEGYYCKNKKEALEKIIELTPKGSKISWGGSESLFEIGLIDFFSDNKEYTVYDRYKLKTREEIEETFIKSFNCDYYFASSNAVTMDGKLINIDGTGNRVAAMIYGPKNVILIVGINKIEKDEQSAITRARNNASVLNAIRLNADVPCTKAGSCVDCTNDSCICCHIVVTRMSRIKNRIKVIIVGEELGF